MFERMLSNLNNKAVSTLMRGAIYMPQPRPQQEQPSDRENKASGPRFNNVAPRRRTDAEYKTSKATLPSEEEAQRRAASAPQGQRETTMPVKHSGPRIGRNDPCPCGSGKKYKNCHGRGL